MTTILTKLEDALRVFTITVFRSVSLLQEGGAGGAEADMKHHLVCTLSSSNLMMTIILFNTLLLI